MKKRYDIELGGGVTLRLTRVGRSSAQGYCAQWIGCSLKHDLVRLYTSEEVQRILFEEGITP